MEVFDPRHGEVHESIQEGPHAITTHGDHERGGSTFTNLKVRDGLFGFDHDRLLAGNHGQSVGDHFSMVLLELLVLKQPAHPNVDHSFHDPWLGQGIGVQCADPAGSSRGVWF